MSNQWASLYPNKFVCLLGAVCGGGRSGLPLESSRNGTQWTLLDLAYFCHSILLWFLCLDIPISLAIWMDSKRIMLKELVLALQAVRRCVKAMPSLLFADRLHELKCEKSIPAGQRASLRSLRFTMFFGMYSAPYQSMCIVKSSNRLLHEDIWCIPRCTFTARMWQIFKPVQSLGHSRMHV